MLTMYPPASTENFSRLDLASFRNPCGRRGCGHIFEYRGPHPLENISRLVNEHWHHCPGRNNWSLHAPNTRLKSTSRVREPVVERDPSVENLSVSSERRGRSPSPSPGPSSSGTQSASSSSGTSSSSPSVRSTRSLTPASAATDRPAKKTARTEAERRAALESDEWTMSVTPHEVVCRGCKRPIKLDRRSRYYPGLWEKHRDRCEHVSKKRRRLDHKDDLADDMDVREALKPFAGGAPRITGSSASYPTLRTAPRKS
ncbi:hypothetical protein B0H11DRAFT_752274 [Mycena galericulata]|nr:hypothetical protein B0H11DRAFT_752274 [Mycena galericulata]